MAAILQSIENGPATNNMEGSCTTGNHSMTHDDLFLGTVADRGMVRCGFRYDSARRLRAKVYIDEHRWLPESCRDELGRETDDRDPHCLHVAASTNNAFDQPEVFANLRYIFPAHEDDLLPVEEEFGIRLGGSQDKLEISRLMSRHPLSIYQELGSVMLVSHAMGLLTKLEVAGYAIIEEPLLRRMKGMGLVIAILTDATVLADFGGTVNFGVRVDARASIERAKAIAAKKPLFMYSRFFDIAVHGTDQDLAEEAMAYLRQKTTEEALVA